MTQHKSQIRSMFRPQANLCCKLAFRLPEICSYGSGNQDEIVALRRSPAKHLWGDECRYIDI